MSPQEVQQDIRTWLHQQPDWLQQAAEIILVSGRVTPNELDRLHEYMKTPQGVEVTAHRNYSQLGVEGSESGIRLTQIDELIGLDNLAPREPLDFGTGNLVVVYGQNGSGKSGYTRLIKKVCGKLQGRELKPNVFEPAPAVRRCRLTFQVLQETRTVEWLINADPVPELLDVDVFDAETANAYLTKESAAAYTPRSVSLFEKLVDVCDQIRLRLQSEQNLLVKALPVLPAAYQQTPAGVAYSDITVNNGDRVIEDFNSWGAEDERSLAALDARLAADPAVLAASKRATMAQAARFSSELKKISDAFGVDALKRLAQLRDDFLDKKRISEESSLLLKSEVKGVGTDTWRAMWEAARAFSSSAYPGHAFPVLEEARCLFCHQTLDGDAKLRLAAFDEYVRGRIESDLASSSKILKRAIDTLPLPLTDPEIVTYCQASGLDGEKWHGVLRGFMQCVAASRKSVLDGSNYVHTDGAELLLGDLQRHYSALESEANQHDLDSRGLALEQVKRTKLEMEARRWVSQQSEAVSLEVGRLKRHEYLEGLKRSSNSHRISTKAGEVAEKVITDAFVARFNRELSLLGAKRIKIELVKSRTEKGRALHKLRLVGVQSAHDVPEIILSEGERRIVCLAAFLADVADRPRHSPFIFDDPISSLDSDFEWNVAMRLADLSRSRQVLVFTHRLSLCGALEEVEGKVKERTGTVLGVKIKHIQRFDGTAGHPNEMPGWGRNTSKSNNALLARLEHAVKSGPREYPSLAQGICSDFRKLIESTIEKDLLHSIVVRHRRSITSKGLLSKLPKLNASDCSFLDDMMTKYSDYEHSQSEEKPAFIPDAPELRSDLEALKTWRQEYAARQSR